MKGMDGDLTISANRGFIIIIAKWVANKSLTMYIVGSGITVLESKLIPTSNEIYLLHY
jgi:hypothetical protein